MVTKSILDTDDFAKDAPEHEATVVKWTKDGKAVDGGGFFTVTTGKSYRLPFSATPTTLTLNFRKYQENTTANSHMHKLDISR